MSVEWIQKLRVPNAITGSVVCNNILYFASANGLLYQWNDDGAVVVAQRYGTEYPNCLAVFNNKIYAGGATGGLLLEWNGVNAWVQVAPQLNFQPTICALAVLNGKLYGCTASGERLFEWNGVNAWVQVAPALDADYTVSLTVFNNKLYSGTSDNTGTSGGKLLEWNGVNAWVEVAPKNGDRNSNIFSLLVYNGKLYGGTQANSPGAGGGSLFEWNGVNAWVEVAGRLGGEYDEYGVYALCEYNGLLYGGTKNAIVGGNLQTGAKLFQWDGVASWIEVAHPPISTVYSDLITTLTVFNGKLYAGTYNGFWYEFFKPAKIETGAWTSPSTPSSGTSDGAATGDLGSRVRTLHRTTALSPTVIG